MTSPFSPKIHLLCMLVVKNTGVCVTHISRSATARLMMKMLAGVRRLRLLHSTNTHVGRARGNGSRVHSSYLQKAYMTSRFPITPVTPMARMTEPMV